jgi:MFS transporter, DHA1 family, multidrug resistance protein
MQDSPFGQLVRFCTKGRVFGHPENKPDFQLPWKREDLEDSDKEKEAEAVAEAGNPSGVLSAPSQAQDSDDSEQQAASGPGAGEQSPMQQQTSHVLRPARTPEGIILIDWYDTADKGNPQNWGWQKKLVAVVILDLYTFGIYSCSSIVTPAHNEIMERFNVSYATASLTLSMYVLGYGIAPLVCTTSHAWPCADSTDFLSITGDPNVWSQSDVHNHIRPLCHPRGTNGTRRQFCRFDRLALSDRVLGQSVPRDRSS